MALSLFQEMLSAAVGMLLVLGVSGVASAGAAEKGRFERKITKTVGAEYLILLPDSYDPKGKDVWPLIVFLHGAGERGSDIERVSIHGPIKYGEKTEGFPFIVIAPQCPEDGWWNSLTDVVWALVHHIQEEYRIDSKRIYLTGLSMGGFGTWTLAAEHPDAFASIAPICGGGDPKDAPKIKDVPAWVFHGARDTVVPIQRSEEMVNALKENGSAVKFTIYPEAGHDSWTETYNNPELYSWFLTHRLGGGENTADPSE